MTRVSINGAIKMKCREIATAQGGRFSLSPMQSFYKSKSGKMIFIAEPLANGFYWIPRQWRAENVVEMITE